MNRSLRSAALCCFLLAFVVSLSPAPLRAQPGTVTPVELPALKGKKILVVYGGWEGHSPEAFAKRVAAWLESEGAAVTVTNSLDVYVDEAFMSTVDLIVQYRTMDVITNEQEAGLLKAVRSGAGLAGCHGGIGDSFRNNTNFQYMVGGQWVAHPGGEIDYTVQITDKNDPVTKGVNDFAIHTEQYYMHVDPNVKVLATTAFDGSHDPWIDGAVMPVAWKKYYGQGRVFYLSIGHSPGTFEVPEVWEMLSRGIRWASGSKYLPKEEWMNPVYPSR